METYWREVQSIEEEEEEEVEMEETEEERKSVDGRCDWQVRGQRSPCLTLPTSPSLSRGGGVADRGWAVLPGDWLRPRRGGHAPEHRGTDLYADPPAGGDGEKEAGSLQPDAEEPQPTANQRRAGRLHSGGAARGGGRSLAG